MAPPLRTLPYSCPPPSRRSKLRTGTRRRDGIENVLAGYAKVIEPEVFKLEQADQGRVSGSFLSHLHKPGF